MLHRFRKFTLFRNFAHHSGFCAFPGLGLTKTPKVCGFADGNVKSTLRHFTVQDSFPDYFNCFTADFYGFSACCVNPGYIRCFYGFAEHLLILVTKFKGIRNQQQKFLIKFVFRKLQELSTRIIYAENRDAAQGIQEKSRFAHSGISVCFFIGGACRLCYNKD